MFNTFIPEGRFYYDISNMVTIYNEEQEKG